MSRKGKLNLLTFEELDVVIKYKQMQPFLGTDKAAKIEYICGEEEEGI